MTDTGYSMPVIRSMPIIGKPALSPAFEKSPVNFPWRSSVAYPNAMDHRSTIPKFWLMRRAKSLRNIARLIVCGRARRRTNLLRSWRYVRELCARRSTHWFQHLLRSPVSRNDRKLASEQNVGAFLISSTWPFPRDEHFVCSRKRARSKIKVT